jgi:hypothetical protein
MISVRPDLKIVFLRGVHTNADIEAAVLQKTGLKRWNWREWTTVGLADDDSKSLQTGMPFSPPDDHREVAGFKIKRK